MKRTIRSLRVVGITGLVAARIAVAGDVEVDGKFVTTTTSGPPIEVSSSTLVTGLNADLLDGLNASDLASSVDHVVVVAKSGGQFSSIQGAIDSITGAAEDNRYLVWVGPGVYDEEVTIGSQWIALEGAGRHSTVIRSDGDPGTITDASVVRDVTVEADGAADGVRGISVCTSCLAEISDVTIKATTAVQTPGIEVGASAVVCINCASLDLSNVTAFVESTSEFGFNMGIVASATGSLRLRNVETTTKGGLAAWALQGSADGTGLEQHEPAVLLEHVDAHAFGATSENVGASISGDTFNLPPIRITRTTATADGASARALTVGYGHATIDNVVATATSTTPSQTSALFEDGTFKIFQSRFISPGAAAPRLAVNLDPDATAWVVYSQIVGTFDAPAGSLTCRGNYDDSLADVTCPP